MVHITGQNREQCYLFTVSLEDVVDAKNEVRTIDLFTGSPDLGEFGVKVEFMVNDRPAYPQLTH